MMGLPVTPKVGTRLLIVDDDVQTLESLRRVLRPYRHDWNLRVQCDSRAALDMLESQPADLVIADLGMPGVDGPTFLRQVRDTWPETVRFVLSGHVATPRLVPALGIAHRLFSKPCRGEIIIQAIDRGLAFQQRMGALDESENAFGEAVLSVPPVPWGALVAALQGNWPDVDDLVEHVAALPPVAAKLMQFGHSGFRGALSGPADLEEVVRDLGLDLCRALILDTAMFRVLPPAAPDVPRLERLGAIAGNARRVARYIGQQQGLDRPSMALVQATALLHRLDAWAGDGFAHGTASIVLGLWGCPEGVGDALDPGLARMEGRFVDKRLCEIARVSDRVAGSLVAEGRLPRLRDLKGNLDGPFADTALPDAILRGLARPDA